MGTLTKLGCLLICFGIAKLVIYFYRKGKK